MSQNRIHTTKVLKIQNINTKTIFRLIPVKLAVYKDIFQIEDVPEHDTPDHGHEVEQGSVLVIPVVSHDQAVPVVTDSILVAAIKLHTASSWDEGHTVEGRLLVVAVDKHAGAQVTNGLEPIYVTEISVNPLMLHKLDGTVPIWNNIK